MVGTRQNHEHFNIWYLLDKRGIHFFQGLFPLLSSVKQNRWLLLLSSFHDGAVEYVLQPFIVKEQKTNKKTKHMPVE